jgi:hypothetical protein
VAKAAALAAQQELEADAARAAALDAEAEAQAQAEATAAAATLAEAELAAREVVIPEVIIPEVDIPEVVIDLTEPDVDRVEEPALSLVEEPVVDEVVEHTPEPEMNGNAAGTGTKRRAPRKSTKAPRKTDAPEPVRLEVVRPEIVENEVVTPEVIDLTTGDDDVARARPYLELLPSPAARVDDLHHDSGVEIVEEIPPAPQPTRAMPERSRALRITTVKSPNGRRRWAFDFLVKEPDTDDSRK